jgi:hypothetical protein
MALEPVYIYEHDRATSRLELRKIIPTREFLENTERGMARYAWQNGRWYGTGGEEITEAEVPQRFRDEIEAKPVTVTTHSPVVTAHCKFCGQDMNSSEMEAHLIEHVHKTMKAAGEVKADYTNDRPVTAKNTLKAEKV